MSEYFLNTPRKFFFRFFVSNIIYCTHTFKFLDDIRSIDNVRLLCREFDSLTYVWDYKKNTYGVTVIVELTSYNSTDTDLYSIWPSKVRRT